MSAMPRVEPLPPEDWSAELAPIAEVAPGGGPAGSLAEHNIFRTFARHPRLMRAWLPFGGYLLATGTLPVADRELVILRTAVRCGSSYEWGQHVRIALAVGMSRETIDRVPAGPDAAGWTSHEAALLQAVDELHGTARVSDATWDTLAATYDEQQLIETIVLIGQYHLVAFALNSFGVELDDGLEELPEAAQAG